MNCFALDVQASEFLRLRSFSRFERYLSLACSAKQGLHHDWYVPLEAFRRLKSDNERIRPHRVQSFDLISSRWEESNLHDALAPNEVAYR